MDEVQVDNTNYQMPPHEGFTIAHFLTVADLERSMNFYATVFGGDIVSRGDGNAPPYIRIANTWLIINVGGGPTPDKPTVTLKTPDPNLISSFMNIRVADIDRSVRFYEAVFGARILSRGDTEGAPGYVQMANTWLIVNVGGGPTPDKPTVTLSVLADRDKVSSFMNIRVADIQACYALWKSRGAEFITEPKDKYGETRCYIRDPDGYIIEVGQSKPDFTYG